MKISKVGVAWFRPNEYNALRNLFTDGSGLPETFEEWLDTATNGFNQLRRDGHTVVKAYIHLETFPEWCRSRGLNIDAAARRKFAGEFAMRDDSDDG